MDGETLTAVGLPLSPLSLNGGKEVYTLRASVCFLPISTEETEMARGLKRKTTKVRINTG